MTDFRKYKNVTVPNESYRVIEALQDRILPEATFSRTGVVVYAVKKLFSEIKFQENQKASVEKLQPNRIDK